MPKELIFYIVHYGYLAIFSYTFLQEVGVPSPIPNEFILVFSGYMAFAGSLYLPLIILCAFGGDLLAAAILYTAFYLFGKFMLHNKPRWLPISQHTIDKQAKKIEQHGISAVVIGRLSPFIRGYVAVICGILHFKPQRYTFIIFITSVVWSSFYVVTGYFLGPYWNYVIEHINQFKYMFYSILAITIVTVVILFVIKKQLSINK